MQPAGRAPAAHRAGGAGRKCVAGPAQRNGGQRQEPRAQDHGHDHRGRVVGRRKFDPGGKDEVELEDSQACSPNAAMHHAAIFHGNCLCMAGSLCLLGCLENGAVMVTA
jgi:hypothetical protein